MPGRGVGVTHGFAGRVGEWLKPADCKSAAPCGLRRFESSPVHQRPRQKAGNRRAWVAQLVERVLGKDEVTGSIPVPGSTWYAVDERG